MPWSVDTALPLAARLTLGRVSPGWRFEFHGRVSSRSEVRVSFPATGDPSYTLLERVSFAGALGEAALGKRARLAAYGRALRPGGARPLPGRRVDLAPSLRLHGPGSRPSPAEVTGTNQRQIMEGGYRFRSGFELAGGVRWDVDRFAWNPFDGGRLRLAATW